jgi:hypothetical protein
MFEAINNGTNSHFRSPERKDDDDDRGPGPLTLDEAELEIEVHPDFPWSEEEKVSPMPKDARVVLVASPVPRLMDLQIWRPDVRQGRFLHTMLDARQQEVPRAGEKK